MEQPIIEIKNIGKRYNITHQRGGYVALRDVLMNILKSPFAFLKSKAKQVAGLETKEEFWALKDVSFSVNKGEVIGIIGSNGAGKSTLLKILSQITPPTTGEIKIHGRVGSLLEVGTGFHPELTGRENIFLNGAILGMSKKEIVEKFAGIVEFAGIEKFLDTPVKHYSSGMYVRLAFSVAAHMEPDILIIDEVLAVGDAEFQKKCLGKMEEVTQKDGRTILFVSHNMDAIRKICNKGILFKKGIISKIGEINEVVAEYENNFNIKDSNIWKNKNLKEQKEIAYIEEIELIKNNKLATNFLNTEDINIKFKIVVNEPSPYLKFGFSLIKDRNIIFKSEQIDSSNYSEIIKPGTFFYNCQIPKMLLNAGEYFITPEISLHCIKGLSMNTEPVIKFRVTIDGKLSAFHGALNDKNHPGDIFPILSWNKIN
jgi:lipopolysaccharide transport system ATP-binding protein